MGFPPVVGSDYSLSDRLSIDYRITNSTDHCWVNIIAMLEYITHNI